MDQLKGFMGGGGDKDNIESKEQGSGGGFLGGIGDKLNSAAGGGKESEKNEDYLDKGKFSYYQRLLQGSTNADLPVQASMQSSSTALARVTRATSRLWSRQRMSRSRISFVGSTRGMKPIHQ